MVTYGGMARLPAAVPTGALIFKNISARGFWLSRWLADEKKAADAAEAAEATEATAITLTKAAADAVGGAKRTPRRIREMTDELCGLVRDGKLRMPAREVLLEDVVSALASPPEVGRRKLLIRFPDA